MKITNVSVSGELRLLSQTLINGLHNPIFYCTHHVGSSILTTKEDLKRTKRELREEYAKIKEASIDVGQRAQTVRTRLDEGAQLARKIQEMRWELTVIRSSQSPDKVCIWRTFLNLDLPSLHSALLSSKSTNVSLTRTTNSSPSVRRRLGSLSSWSSSGIGLQSSTHA